MSGIKNSEFKGTTFQVGDEVVCINSEGMPSSRLKRGNVYTLTGVREGTYLDQPCVYLDSDHFYGMISTRFELVNKTPSELEEALAKIDSLEELVSSLSDDLKEAKEIDRSIKYKASLNDQVVKLLSSHPTMEGVYRGQHGEEVITDTIKLLQKSYDERTTLIAAVKSLKMIISDNINVLDNTELDALSIVDSTLKDILKPEVE